jgi:hypothetical protein
MEEKGHVPWGFYPEERSVRQVQREAGQRRQTTSEEGPALAAFPLPAGADLFWIKCAEPPCLNYQLQAGDDVVARLRFSHPLDSAATGESATGAWTFAEESLLRPHVSVRTLPGKRPLAAYRSGFLGLSGQLEFVDGRRFCWRRWGLHTWDCCFENAQGTSLVAVDAKCCRSWLFGSRLMGGLVRIEPGADALSELMVLVLLSWYLLVLPCNEAALRCPP